MDGFTMFIGVCFVFLMIFVAGYTIVTDSIIKEQDKISEQNNTSNKTLIDTISNYTEIGRAHV